MNYILSIFLIMLCNLASLFGADNEIQSKSLQSFLEDMHTSLVQEGAARNDFMCIAHCNLPEALKSKIEKGESEGDVDKYYTRMTFSIGDQKVILYETPLHHAVFKANVEVTQALLEAGADQNKIIKTDEGIQEDDLAKEKYPSHRYFKKKANLSHSVDQEFKEFKRDLNVGLSVVALAQKLLDFREDKKEGRQKIVNLLLGQK